MSTDLTHNPPVGQLAKALAAFQADMPTVPKTKTANTGSYSYTYADLAAVTQAAMPLLAKNGLAFITRPQQGEHGMSLVGTLLHSGGEQLEGALPLTGRSPQEIGSSITYMRRYLLGCLTGLVTDDDDDGAAASAPARPAPRKQAPAKQAPAKQTPAKQTPAWSRPAAAKPDTGPANTDKLRGRMFALFTDRSIEDANQQRAGMSKVLGREIESRADLTVDDMRAVIASLEAGA